MDGTPQNPATPQNSAAPPDSAAPPSPAAPPNLVSEIPFCSSGSPCSVPFERVAIIGVGLIGGSLASALKALENPPTVWGITHAGGSLDGAVGSGALDEGAAAGDAAGDARIAEWLSPGGADLVVIATPVSAARPWFELLAEHAYDGVVTDVASTKGVITKIASEVLDDTSRYLPSHPMAGSEASGFSAGRADLFDGAYWIVCPDDATDDAAYLALHETFSTLGARVISVPRESHDAAVATVSHVPHVMASATVELASRHAKGHEEILRLAAGGFKDTTRIAAGSPDLWCGIALDNSEALADGLEELGEILDDFEDAIRKRDAPRVRELLARSADVRRGLPATWVPDSTRLVEARIPMTNRAGVIAEVTSIAAHAGCNIESIGIDHTTESTAVLELVLTDEGDMGRLASALVGAGYDFSLKPLGE